MEKQTPIIESIVIRYKDQKLHVSFVVSGISVILLFSKNGMEFTFNK